MEFTKSADDLTPHVLIRECIINGSV